MKTFNTWIGEAARVTTKTFLKINISGILLSVNKGLALAEGWLSFYQRPTGFVDSGDENLL